MNITEVRVKLVRSGHDKLRAFCSITIDNNFVVRDLKVIEGPRGAFVAMPSRKLTNRCSRCNGKNHHGATYCNDCGARLSGARSTRVAGGRAKFHADIAHPINSECRSMIQRRVLEVYEVEISRSRDPSYKPVDFDDFDDFNDFEIDKPARELTTGELVTPDGTHPASGRASRVAVQDTDRVVGGGGTGDEQAVRSDGRPWREPRKRGVDAFEGGGVRQPMASAKTSTATERTTERTTEESDREPEDNFGAGLFS